MNSALVFNVSFIFWKVALSNHNTSPATIGILTRKPLSAEHTRQYNVLESENVRYFPHGTFILPCIGRLLFSPQYLRQFFIKSNNQGQFQNQLIFRIPKLSLVVRFDKDLAEILRVKEKASISKWYHFYWTRVYEFIIMSHN